MPARIPVGSGELALQRAGSFNIALEALAIHFPGALDSQLWTFFLAADIALIRAILTSLSAAKLQDYIVSLGGYDRGLLCEQLTILSSAGVEYDVGRVNSTKNVDSSKVFKLATGDSGAAIYSIDGILTGSAATLATGALSR